MTLRVDNPVLVLIRGLPGSGKSHIAERLQHAVGDGVVMLDPDVIDFKSQAYAAHAKALSAEGVDEKLHAYRFLRGQAYQGIAEHKIIVWNQPFTNLEIFHKMMANLRAQAEENHTTLSVLIVEVEIDQTVAQERVRQRKASGGHGPSDATFKRFMDDYRSFAGEGYETVRVDGDGDVAEAVAAIMDALRALEAAE